MDMEVNGTVVIGDLHCHYSETKQSLPEPPTPNEFEKFKSDARILFQEQKTRILNANGTNTGNPRLADVLVHTHLLVDAHFFCSSRDSWMQRIGHWWGRRTGLASQTSQRLCRASSSSLASRSSVEELATPEHVIESYQDEEGSNLLLVVGATGSGKTCLSHRFMHEASREGSPFEFFFRVEFRGIGNDYTTLKELLFSHAAVDWTEQRKTELFEHIVQQDAPVLVTLDGLDEYSHFQQLNEAAMKKMSLHERRPASVVLANLMLGNLLKRCLVVVTSRPARANQLRRCFSESAKVYSVQPLTEEQRHEYCCHLLADEDQVESIQQRSAVWNAMTTPIVCQLVCAVIPTVEEQSPHGGGVTLLYARFILAFMESEHVTLEDAPTAGERAQLTRNLAKIAWRCVANGKATFPEKELCVVSTISGGRKPNEAFISNFLAVILHSGASAKGERECYFEHRSLQEFFAALWLWLSPVRLNQREKQILSDPDSLVLTFFCGLRNDEVRRFWRVFFPHDLTAVNQSSTYSYAKQTLQQQWRQRRRGFSNCSTALQAVCESGDQQLLRTFASNLPRKIEINSRPCGPQILAPMGAILQSRQTKTSVDVRLGQGHERAFGDLLSRAIDRIDLGNNHLTPEAASRLCASISDRGIELDSVSFQHNADIGDGVANELATVCQHARCLDAWDCGVTAVGIERFASFLDSVQEIRLKELNFGMNRIGDTGVSILSRSTAVQRCVTILKVCDCDLSDQGAESLSLFVSNQNCVLEYLDARKNRFTETGYEVLLRAVLSSTRMSTFKVKANISAAKFAEINNRNGLKHVTGVWIGRGFEGNGDQMEFELKRRAFVGRTQCRRPAKH